MTPRPSQAEPERVSSETAKGRRFVSLRVLAARWSCDRSTVRRNLEAAGIKAYLLGHGTRGTVRYDLADVERYERGCQEP